MAEMKTMKTLTVNGQSYEVVDEVARNAASSGGYKIGDIKSTLRTDLGDKWVLCNGATVDPAVYPELAEICPRQKLEDAVIQVKTIWSATSTGCEINDVKYLNGYWVVAGMRYYNSYRQASIAYTTNLETGSWTTKDLWYDTFGAYLYTIDYINGYWVVGGSYSVTAQRTVYYGRIAYATSLSGTWTPVDLWNGTISSNYVTSIAYGDGYWVAAGKNYSGSGASTIAYATSLDGTWTAKNLWSGNNNCGLNCITYANGYWVVGGGTHFSDTNGNSSTYVPHARIAYATDPTGTWTTKDLWTSETKGDNSIDSSIHCIAYANGYWVAGGGCGINYTDTKAQIAYATSLSGTWTQVPLWTSSGCSGDGWYTNVSDIIFDDGQWMATGTSYDESANYTTTYKVANSVDLDTWDIRDIGQYQGVNSFGSSITYNKPYFVIGRNAYDGTTYTALIDYFPMGRVVPTITGDYYTYIKAKE